MQEEIFSKLNNEKHGDHNGNQQVIDSSKVDEICWLVCQKRYVDRRKGKQLLTREDIHKLWCIFNFVSESDDTDKPRIPIIAHRDEVALIVQKLLTSIGKQYDKDEFNEATDNAEEFSFEAYVQLLEHTYLESLDRDAVSCTIAEIYEQYIQQVLKKVRTTVMYSVHMA